MEKLVLLDIENLKGKFNPEKVLDLQKLIRFVKKEFGKNSKIVCYIKCASNEEVDKIRKSLGNDIELKYIIKNHFKGDPDLDVALAVDAMDATLRCRVNHIILGSGDADYALLLDYLEREGIKIEILANKTSFALNLSKRASTIVFIPDECFTKGENNGN